MKISGVKIAKLFHHSRYGHNYLTILKTRGGINRWFAKIEIKSVHLDKIARGKIGMNHWVAHKTLILCQTNTRYCKVLRTGSILKFGPPVANIF